MGGVSGPAENPSSLHVGDQVVWRGLKAVVSSVELYPRVMIKFEAEFLGLVHADELEKI